MESWLEKPFFFFFHSIKLLNWKKSDWKKNLSTRFRWKKVQWFFDESLTINILQKFLKTFIEEDWKLRFYLFIFFLIHVSWLSKFY